MNLQIQPGSPIGDICPTCKGSSILVNQLSTVSFAGYQRVSMAPQAQINAPISIERVRACTRCLIEWDTLSSGVPGDQEYLKMVRQHSQSSFPSVTTRSQFITQLQQNTVTTTTFANTPFGEPLMESSGPLPPIPSIPSAVIGYRAWRISDTVQMSLMGTSGYGESWVPGVNQAKCAVSDHSAPSERCSCGMYALARFNDKNSWWKGDHILGAVEAWSDPDTVENRDRFFLHPDPGFRAQYAKIVLLATGERHSRLKNDFIRKVLAPYYGADVVKREHLEDAAKEHGNLVPEELIRWVQDSQKSKEAADRHLSASLPKGAAGDAEVSGEGFAIPHPNGFTIPYEFVVSEAKREERIAKTRKGISREKMEEALRFVSELKKQS